MSTTRISDSDLASVALYDKVNAIANEIDEEKTNYSDFNRLNNEVVKLTGNQTIDDVKTFTNVIKRTNALNGSPTIITILEDTNNKGAVSHHAYYTGGKLYNRNVAENKTSNKQAYTDVICSDDGVGTFQFKGTVSELNVDFSNATSCYVPTPPASSNGTNAATTAWVKANAPAPTITYLD